jgi:hypothetical protein
VNDEYLSLFLRSADEYGIYRNSRDVRCLDGINANIAEKTAADFCDYRLMPVAFADFVADNSQKKQQRLS